MEYKKFICLLWSLSKTSHNKKFDSILGSILVEFKLKSNVTFVVSEKIKHPFVIGFREVYIALPLRDYTEAQLRYIISHELNHVKHHDFLWKLFFEVLSAIYWWYPLIYVFRHSFSTLLEVQNDMRCIDKMSAEDQHSYLSSILEESKSRETCSRFVLPFSTNKKSFLHRRFSIILNSGGNKSFKMQVLILTILAVLFLLSISVSLAPVSL